MIYVYTQTFMKQFIYTVLYTTYFQLKKYEIKSNVRGIESRCYEIKVKMNIEIKIWDKES